VITVTDSLNFLHCCEVDRRGLARFKRKQRKDKLNLKRNIRNRGSSDFSNNNG
jgi:hypothetical protein